MQDQNSFAEFVLSIFREQLVDCSRWYPELTKEFDRDLLRLSSAANSHGIRFFLETMPAFRKHLDKCLTEELLIPSNLTNFGVVKKGEAIPRLFRGLTLRVFGRNGMLKDQPDMQAVRCLRQLLGVVAKLRVDANTRDSGNAVLEFYRVDMATRTGDLEWEHHESFSAEVNNNDKTFVSLVSADNSRTADLFPSGEGQVSIPIRDLRGALNRVQHVADHIASALGSFDPHEWVFRHGPGSVAGSSFGSNKYDFKRWPDRLESVFPWADFAIANYALGDMEPVEVARARGFTHEVPAKLCAVRKTIKTPRLIACEPVALQWCQQAIRDYLYSKVESSYLSKFVDFRRQDKNGILALEASHTQSHATIDLTSASDWISCWHVERLFRRSPMLLRALQATRSAWIEQRICKYSPRYHKLRKYSTMGNATTFPVQTILFTAIALGCVLYTRGLRVCDGTMKSLQESAVRVFGDDIIVPKDSSGLLVGVLQALGLKVNAAKTFLRGKFRESCGVDAFRGEDVSSVRVLEMPRRAAPSSIASCVDVHNNLLKAGYLCTAAYLRKTATSLGFSKIREIEDGDGAFGWMTYDIPNNAQFRTRVNRDTQVREIRCLGPRPKCIRIPAENNPGLLQFFTEAAKVVTSAKSTLGHLGQRPKSSLALGWRSVD